MNSTYARFSNESQWLDYRGNSPGNDHQDDQIYVVILTHLLLDKMATISHLKLIFLNEDIKILIQI